MVHDDKTALLLKCHYPYDKPQIWFPTDLYKVAARLDSVGIRTTIVDLNVDSFPANISDYDFVGIGVVGPPYIPVSIKVAQRVEQETGKRPLIGGPGVEHLSSAEFEQLYGDAVQIRNGIDLSRAVGKSVPDVYEMSIVSQINSTDPAQLREYLTHELSFFVSQGCRYACDFCAADRTRPGRKVVERFSQTINSDLEALCQKAEKFGIKTLSMYLTSLDLFQNPTPFRGVLGAFSALSRRYGVQFVLRGLSRVDSFLSALDEEPVLRTLVPEAGLKTVGFGIDGTTEAVWRSQHKGNKGLSDVEKAFEQCSTLGITPESLMVMGFHDLDGNPVDTEESLRTNVEYSLQWANSKGVVARPHVAKDMVPGNNGWNNPVWSEQRQRLLAQPELFRNLDFVSLASELTHPNSEFRGQVNVAYLDIITALTPSGLCATSPLLPYSGNSQQNSIARAFNMLIPFDK